MVQGRDGKRLLNLRRVLPGRASAFLLKEPEMPPPPNSGQGMFVLSTLSSLPVTPVQQQASPPRRTLGLGGHC